AFTFTRTLGVFLRATALNPANGNPLDRFVLALDHREREGQSQGVHAILIDRKFGDSILLLAQIHPTTPRLSEKQASIKSGRGHPPGMSRPKNVKDYVADMHHRLDSVPQSRRFVDFAWLPIAHQRFKRYQVHRERRRSSCRGSTGVT